MRLLDSSVVIPALLSWHEAHAQSVRQLADRPALPIAVAIEAYSVLTRLPHPHRIPGPIAAELLDRTFPTDRRLAPDPDHLVDMPARCAAAGVEGGAVYDAVIAATAVAHGATLVSRDRRAARTYEVIGASVEMLQATPELPG